MKNRNPSAYFNEGLHYFKKGDYRKALENFKIAFELDSSSPGYGSYYGRLLVTFGGKKARGLELCRWALDKERVVAHYVNLAKAYESAGDLMTAQKVYNGLDCFCVDMGLQDEQPSHVRKGAVKPFADGKSDTQEMRQQLSSLFRKVADRRVTREEGAIFLKDLLKKAEAGLVVEEIVRLTACPPPGVYVKTMLHTLLLTGNTLFVDVLSKSIAHADEETAVFAARGLASLNSHEALKVLVRFLDNENYVCRKAAAEALAEGFGREGIEALKRHITAINDRYIGMNDKLASVEALLRNKGGIRALVEIMAHDDNGFRSQFILEAMSDHARGHQKIDFLKKTLREISETDERKSGLVTELLKALGSKA